MTKLKDAIRDGKEVKGVHPRSFHFWKLTVGTRGQGMTEYILIVVLIAVAALVTVKMFGGKIKGLFQKSADTIESGTKGAFDGK